MTVSRRTGVNVLTRVCKCCNGAKLLRECHGLSDDNHRANVFQVKWCEWQHDYSPFMQALRKALSITSNTPS